MINKICYISIDLYTFFSVNYKNSLENLIISFLTSFRQVFMKIFVYKSSQKCIRTWSVRRVILWITHIKLLQVNLYLTQGYPSLPIQLYQSLRYSHAVYAYNSVTGIVTIFLARSPPRRRQSLSSPSRRDPSRIASFIFGIKYELSATIFIHSRNAGIKNHRISSISENDCLKSVFTFSFSFEVHRFQQVFLQ